MTTEIVKRSLYNSIINWCFFAGGITAVLLFLLPSYWLVIVLLSGLSFVAIYKTRLIRVNNSMPYVHVAPIGFGVSFEELSKLNKQQMKKRLGLGVFENSDTTLNSIWNLLEEWKIK